MNTVEKVRAICKERKIPISRLEKDLGFSNGYIGQLKKGTMPYDRLIMVASYLEVTTAYLTGIEENKPTTMGELTEIQREAMELIMELTDEQLKVFIAALKSR